MQSLWGCAYEMRSLGDVNYKITVYCLDDEFSSPFYSRPPRFIRDESLINQGGRGFTLHDGR
jgi:hypothetical protein